MPTSMNFTKRSENRSSFSHLSLILFFIFATPLNGEAGSRSFNKSEINILTEQLKSEELPEPYLRKLFSNPALRKISKAAKLNITTPLNLTHNRYKHFLEPYAIKKAVKFSRKWRGVLKETEKRFDVDKEVVVAVLLVETGLGRIQGRYLLLSVFASLYIDAGNLIKTKSEKISEKSIKKRAWALRELRVLLELNKSGKVDIFRLKGSYAGAFGLPQFLPSSYRIWAISRSGRKRPNLFWEPDAIFSLANYLKGHGYRYGIENENNKKAIWMYNHSNVYVETVLGVARILHKETR